MKNKPIISFADISIKSGPAQVSRENTKRRITIGFNVRNRDVQSVIAEVTKQIDNQVKLPTGYYVSYGGQFQNLEAAKERLASTIFKASGSITPMASGAASNMARNRLADAKAWSLE